MIHHRREDQTFDQNSRVNSYFSSSLTQFANFWFYKSVQIFYATAYVYVLSLREIKISIGAPQLEPRHGFVEGVASNSTIKLLITMLFQWGINFIANLSHFVVIIGESVFPYVMYCFGPFILDDSVAKRQDEYICRFYRNCLRGTQKILE